MKHKKRILYRYKRKRKGKDSRFGADFSKIKCLVCNKDIVVAEGDEAFHALAGHKPNCLILHEDQNISHILQTEVDSDAKNDQLKEIENNYERMDILSDYQDAFVIDDALSVTLAEGHFEPRNDKRIEVDEEILRFVVPNDLDEETINNYYDKETLTTYSLRAYVY